MSQQKKNVSILKVLLITVIFGYGAYSINPNDTDMEGVRWFCIMMAGLGAWIMIRELPNQIYNWLLRRRAMEATHNHGSAQWAGIKTVASYGLHDANGLFMGVSAFDGKPIFQHGEGHWMVYAPTRSGKSRSLVLPNILHYPGSMLIPDIKGELWDVTSDACRKVHKNTVYRSTQINELIKSKKNGINHLQKFQDELSKKKIANNADIQKISKNLRFEEYPLLEKVNFINFYKRYSKSSNPIELSSSLNESAFVL